MQQYYSPNDPRFSANTDSASIQNAIDAAIRDHIPVVRIPRLCSRTGLPDRKSVV